MSEELIVKHCSPTLAGMKTGNIFNCTFKNREDMYDNIRRWNRILGKKGIRVIPLRIRENRAMVYVFRPNHLSRDLKHGVAHRILQERGYCTDRPCLCIRRLMESLKNTEEFPHEIGLFLGYPPEDVLAFITNKDEGCKCIGCWKVYGDVDAAQKIFEKYKKCTNVYCTKHAMGRPIEKLAVAG